MEDPLLNAIPGYLWRKREAEGSTNLSKIWAQHQACGSRRALLLPMGQRRCCLLPCIESRSDGLWGIRVRVRVGSACKAGHVLGWVKLTLLRLGYTSCKCGLAISIADGRNFVVRGGD